MKNIIFFLMIILAISAFAQKYDHYEARIHNKKVLNEHKKIIKILDSLVNEGSVTADEDSINEIFYPENFEYSKLYSYDVLKRQRWMYPTDYSIVFATKNSDLSYSDLPDSCIIYADFGLYRYSETENEVLNGFVFLVPDGWYVDSCGRSFEYTQKVIVRGDTLYLKHNQQEEPLLWKHMREGEYENYLGKTIFMKKYKEIEFNNILYRNIYEYYINIKNERLVMLWFDENMKLIRIEGNNGNGYILHSN